MGQKSGKTDNSMKHHIKINPFVLVYLHYLLIN